MSDKNDLAYIRSKLDTVAEGLVEFKASSTARFDRIEELHAEHLQAHKDESQRRWRVVNVTSTIIGAMLGAFGLPFWQWIKMKIGRA